MLELIGRWIPGFDPATGILTLPPWAVAAGAVVFSALLLLIVARVVRMSARVLLAGGRRLRGGAGFLRSFMPDSSQKLLGTVARVMVLLAGTSAAWYGFNIWTERDLASERRGLDARAFELTSRALMPGSALACLDAGAGDTVEASCEKALFATPEAAATAVAFVAAQLSLLADGAAFARRDRSYAKALTNLQRALEKDRFGLVAHALAARDGCTPDDCRAFALLTDAGRVRTNLADHSYDFYVVRHASGWPPITRPPGDYRPTAAADPSAPVAAPVPAAAPAALPASLPPEAANAQASARPVVKPPGPNVFFPSAASIPPVSIMNNEPTAPPSERTAPGAKPTPTPPRRPSTATPSTQPHRPADVNATARTEPTATQ
jgi:hypothetical protein